nr:NUDIX domain-containing protein [Streptomyces hyaluromycini]
MNQPDHRTPASGTGSPGGAHTSGPKAAEYTVPVDVHMFLRRDSAAGPLVLLTRRAGPVYATWLRHAPSGRLDGPHEDLVAAVIRETCEETGVLLDRADVGSVVTLHHRAPGGAARIGVFFAARSWQGTPQIMEPDKCDAMDWFPLDALPEPMVAYCRAGIDAYRAGATLAVHFQQPGDPIAHHPATDPLTLAPTAGQPTAGWYRTRRCVTSPSVPSARSAHGRTARGRGQRAECGGPPASTVAPGTSSSTRTSGSIGVKCMLCGTGPASSARPPRGWSRPTTRTAR